MAIPVDIKDGDFRGIEKVKKGTSYEKEKTQETARKKIAIFIYDQTEINAIIYYYPVNPFHFNRIHILSKSTG
ncbi:hypothetical protein GCM10009865_10090 [Aeromicrobium ponti]